MCLKGHGLVVQPQQQAEKAVMHKSKDEKESTQFRGFSALTSFSFVIFTVKKLANNHHSSKLFQFVSSHGAAKIEANQNIDLNTGHSNFHCISF